MNLCLLIASQGVTELGCWALALLRTHFPAGPDSRGLVGKMRVAELAPANGSADLIWRQEC